MDLLTSASHGSSGSVADFKCFYCEDAVVGDIGELRAHFDAAHAGETFKVKSLAAKASKATGGRGATTGYLECQLCGHLTAGFERSCQRVHFHEEHPLETEVTASKYVAKKKQIDKDRGDSAKSAESAKLDMSRFNGMTMRCPKEDCSFEAKVRFDFRFLNHTCDNLFSCC